MFPTIIRFDGFALYSYGFLLFISFLIGIKLTQVRAKKFGVKETTVTNLAFYVLLGVILGARLLYVITHWQEFKDDIIGIIAFWRGGLGGLMFFGGLIGGFAFGLYFAFKNRLPVFKMLDAITPAILLGEFFTRIGCFLNGCCFGKPTNCFSGVIFPFSSPAGSQFADIKIHPTQLYSSLFGLCLFLITLKLEKTKLKNHSGLIFSGMLFLHTFFRLIIDFFYRYYENSLNRLVNQGISFSIMVVLAILFLSRYRAKP